MNIWSLL